MALLDPVRTLGLSRGVFGNSKFWLVVGGAAWGVRAVSWARHSSEKTLFRQVLEPGQTLMITTTGPALRPREVRRGRKAEKQLGRRERREQVATARMRHRHRIL